MRIIYNNIVDKTLPEGEKIIKSLLKNDIYLKHIKKYMLFKVEDEADFEYTPGFDCEINRTILKIAVPRHNEKLDWEYALNFTGRPEGTKENNKLINVKWQCNNNCFIVAMY